MPQGPERLAELKRIAKEYVGVVRANTVCVHCGDQPIDWHHEEHTISPKQRVSYRTAQGQSIATIQAEIDRCTPLCRSCHMALDGRAAALTANRPRKKGDRLPVQPCVGCGRPDGRRAKGLCDRCYARKRYWSHDGAAVRRERYQRRGK